MKRLWIIVAGVMVCATWLAWVAQRPLLAALGFGWDGSALGQWGDTFGALNALFSALAFVAVLFTLKQQREDLARQQAQIFAADRDQHSQRFETTFYELLRLLREARDAVEFRHTADYLRDTSYSDRHFGDRATGLEAFKRANLEMLYWCSKDHRRDDEFTAKMLRDIYLDRVHNRYESSFAPYYRLLYTLLLRIKEDTVISQAQKYRYGNLLRSQLTSHEVALCGYNGLAAISGSFKELIVEFRLAKYLPNQFGRKRLEAIYPQSTFAGRD